MALHAEDEEACDYVGRKMNHLKLCGRRTSADLWGCAEHTKWLWSDNSAGVDAFSIITD